MAGLGRDEVALKRAREATMRMESKDKHLNLQRQLGLGDAPVETDITKAILNLSKPVDTSKVPLKPRLSDYMK